MNTEKVYPFLRDIAAHNSREWFTANKDRYIAAREEVVALAEELILTISKIDPAVQHLTARDCLYRFYRDVRFSPDKSPYKRHFGIVICAKGRSAIYGGYYIHLQPANTFLAVGTYCLPMPLLTACRNEIVANSDDWCAIVQSKPFLKYFGPPSALPPADYTDAMAPKGFGTMPPLKRCPKGFAADAPCADYLRMRDYCCWHVVDDSFFAGAWQRPLTDIFRAAQPMNNFINSVIGDYE